jgi:hypothetical protein
MKRVVLLVAVALLFPTLLAAEDWSNVSIIDRHCADKEKANADAHTRDCALMCSKSGYGVIDKDGNYLKFDAKGNEEATKLLQSSTQKDHLRVNVTGTKDGQMIHVQTLSMAS